MNDPCYWFQGWREWVRSALSLSAVIHQFTISSLISQGTRWLLLWILCLINCMKLSLEKQTSSLAYLFFSWHYQPFFSNQLIWSEIRGQDSLELHWSASCLQLYSSLLTPLTLKIWARFAWPSTKTAYYSSFFIWVLEKHGNDLRLALSPNLKICSNVFQSILTLGFRTKGRDSKSAFIYGHSVGDLQTLEQKTFKSIGRNMTCRSGRVLIIFSDNCFYTHKSRNFFTAALPWGISEGEAKYQKT